MKKNMFFDWIRQFDEKEIKAFKKSFKGEVRNRQLFINSISRTIQDWKNSPNIQSFTTLINNFKQKKAEKYSEKINTLVNKLKPNLLSFIVGEATRKDKLLLSQVLFKFAKNKKYKEGYFYYLDERQKEIDASENRSFDYLYENFKINYERYFAPEFVKYKSVVEVNNENYAPSEVLSSSWHFMQLHNMTIQLRLACEMIAATLLNNSDIDDVLINNKELELINEKIEFYNHEYKYRELVRPVILYLKFYHLLIRISYESKNLHIFSDFMNLIKLTKNSIKLFSNEEQGSLLILLINSFILIQNNYSKDPNQIYYEIIEIGLEADIYGKESLIADGMILFMYEITAPIKEIQARKISTDYLSFVDDTNKDWLEKYFQARNYALKDKNGNRDYLKAIKGLLKLSNKYSYNFSLYKNCTLLRYLYELKIQEDRPSNYEIDDLIALSNIKSIGQNFLYSIENSEYFKEPSNEVLLLYKNFIYGVLLLFDDSKDISIKRAFVKNNRMQAKNWFLKKLDNIND